MQPINSKSQHELTWSLKECVENREKQEIFVRGEENLKTIQSFVEKLNEICDVDTGRSVGMWEMREERKRVTF